MTLLIVDDESLIHASIEYCLKQLSVPDLNVIHAYSANEMLAKMLQQHVDATLVDIRMGAASGLEAIRDASSRWPDTLYYVMTSFSEFEYARTAISLGVTDYLLKPIDIAMLGKVVQKVRDNLQQRETKIRENFRGWLSAAESLREISYLYPPDYFTAVVLLTYDAEQPRREMWVPDFVMEQHDIVVSLPCPEGLMLLIYSPDSRKVNHLTSGFLRSGYPRGVTIFITSTCRSSAKLFEQLKALFLLARKRVFLGIGCRYDVPAAAETPKVDMKACDLWIRLWDDLFLQNTADYFSQLQRLSAYYQNKDWEPPEKHLADYIDSILGTGGTCADTAMRDLLPRLSKAVQPQVYSQKSPDKLDAVLEYVNDHYAANISLEDIAQKFNLTPNYLSTLFKRRFGVKFTDYLTDLRLNRAKQLLAGSNLSVRAISEQIGYFSQSHFNKVFQKKENCSPLEYRSRNQNK